LAVAATALAAATSVAVSPAVASSAAALAAGAPKAEISVNPAKDSLAVTFTARSTGFPAAVVSYEWTFGDGARATTSGHEVTHRYANAARFTPSVTEVDSEGDKATASGTLELFVCPPGNPNCTETLGNANGVQMLTASGPVGAAATVDLFAGPFKISQCQHEVVPTAAVTDTGFSGNLTVTLVYMTTRPRQAPTTCFASTVPFVDATGQTVRSGTLPKCGQVPMAPCVISDEVSGSNVSKVLLIPPGDPKVGAP
jgi:hypothetical protein